jgi:hypothetical protein
MTMGRNPGSPGRAREFASRSQRRDEAETPTPYRDIDGPARPGIHRNRETDMRALMRDLIEKGRRLSGAGAERNARMEIVQANRSVIELDRQLQKVGETPPRRAA